MTRSEVRDSHSPSCHLQCVEQWWRSVYIRSAVSSQSLSVTTIPERWRLVFPDSPDNFMCHWKWRKRPLTDRRREGQTRRDKQRKTDRKYQQLPFCIQQAESTVYIRKAGSTLRETCTDYGFIINLAIAAVAILIGNLLCHKQYGQ